MTAKEWKLRASGIATTVSLFLTLSAGGALAATPSTADYRNATQPMITGTAVMVNEHQLLVLTEQGEEVMLAIDTRTMVPADLAPEMRMRVEFNYLNDGSRYAKRVIPIRSGQRATRELAYSVEQHDDESDIQYASASGNPYAPTRASRAASVTNQPLDTPLKPIPATDEYVVATRPMIFGQVVAVNDHRIVVDTDQAQRVTLEMDSRTLVPSTLRSGMVVRIENRTMNNGVRLATRITPARSYDVEGEDEDMLVPAGVVGEPVAYNDTDASSTDDEVSADGQGVVTSDGDDASARVTEREELPQTASRQPLMALTALLALGAAGVLAMKRRFHVG